MRFHQLEEASSHPDDIIISVSAAVLLHHLWHVVFHLGK